MRPRTEAEAETYGEAAQDPPTQAEADEDAARAERWLYPR